MKFKSSVKLKYVKWGIPLFLLLFCISAIFPAMLLSDGLDSWHLRGYFPRGVTYGNDTFVAAGHWWWDNGDDDDDDGGDDDDDGDDGDDGEVRADIYNYTSSIEYATFFTSSDGVTWEKRTPSWKNAYYGGIAYGNKTFVAVGACGTILQSDTINASATMPITDTETIKGLIHGSVVDANGDGVASVKVQIRGKETGVSDSYTTDDADGSFEFTDLDADSITQ